MDEKENGGKIVRKEKSFLTYNQQMRRLRNEKDIKCDGSSDKTFLVRAGYFNIVNGYKDPFTCDRDENNKHIYLPGTSLEHLHELKVFDDELRLFFLKYITQIEEEVRTLVGYKFDQCNNGGSIAWYEPKAYEQEKGLQDIMMTISSTYSELSKSHLDYVKHYQDKHNTIPTWIMVKVVNFSTFIKILKNSKRQVKYHICYLYDITDEKGKPNIKLLIGSLHWLRMVRNSCAHNERIFSCRQKSGGRNNNSGRIKEKYIRQLRKVYSKDTDKNLFDMLVYFKYYLPKNEYEIMMLELIEKLQNLEVVIPRNAFDNIRANMGIKQIEDLKQLVDLPKKEIKYNSFDRIDCNLK